LRPRRIRTSPRRRHAGVVAVAVGAFALAGCGGGDRPHLARADATPLIALSKQIAREDKCAQARDIRKLRARTIALVNSRRVPAGLQETLLSGVNQLAVQAPVCVPRVAPVAVAPVEPVTTSRGRGHHDKPRHGHKHHGHDEGH
jgi:hypothetical protein